MAETPARKKVTINTLMAKMRRASQSRNSRPMTIVQRSLPIGLAWTFCAFQTQAA